MLTSFKFGQSSVSFLLEKNPIFETQFLKYNPLRRVAIFKNVFSVSNWKLVSRSI